MLAYTGAVLTTAWSNLSRWKKVVLIVTIGVVMSQKDCYGLPDGDWGR